MIINTVSILVGINTSFQYAMIITKNSYLTKIMLFTYSFTYKKT